MKISDQTLREILQRAPLRQKQQLAELEVAQQEWAKAAWQAEARGEIRLAKDARKNRKDQFSAKAKISGLEGLFQVIRQEVNLEELRQMEAVEAYDHYLNWIHGYGPWVAA